MNEYLLRHVMELFYLFDRKKVTLATFSAEFHCTKKTIVHDLQIIETLAIKYGATLKEDEEGLITYEISDEQRYYQSATRAIAFFYKHRNNYDEYLRRTQFILLQYLFNGINNHDSLSEKLNYSSSNLRLEFKKAKQFISTFQLPTHDYFLNQDFYPEFNKRQALASTLCLVDYKIIPIEADVQIHDFCQFIHELDTPISLKKIREILNRHPVQLSKDNQLKLSIYLAIQKYQILQHQWITSLTVELDQLMKLKEYRIAKELYSIHNSIENNYEICSIAILILLHSENFEYFDVSLFDDIVQPYLSTSYSQVMTLLNEQWNCNYDDSMYDNYLKHELTRLIIKRKFNVLGLKNSSVSEDEFYATHSENYLFNQLLDELGKILCSLLQVQLDLIDLYPIIKLVNLHLLNHEFTYHPLHVFINFRSGKMQERIAEATLKKNFSLINNLTFERSTLKRRDSHHNVILCDYEEKEKPGIHYIQTYNGVGPRLIQSLKTLCFNSLDLSKSLPSKIIRVDRKENSVLTLRNALIETYHLQQPKTFNPLEEIGKQFGHTVVFLYHDNQVEQDCIICGKLNKPVTIERMSYDSYLYFVMKPSVEKLLVYGAFLKDYQFNHESKDFFFNNPTQDSYRKIVMNSLQNPMILLK